MVPICSTTRPWPSPVPVPPVSIPPEAWAPGLPTSPQRSSTDRVTAPSLSTVITQSLASTAVAGSAQVVAPRAASGRMRSLCRFQAFTDSPCSSSRWPMAEPSSPVPSRATDMRVVQRGPDRATSMQEPGR